MTTSHKDLDPIEVLKKHIPPELTQHNFIGDFVEDSRFHISGYTIGKITNNDVCEALIKGFNLYKYDYGDPLDSKAPLSRKVVDNTGRAYYTLFLPNEVLDKLCSDLRATSEKQTQEKISQLIVQGFQESKRFASSMAELKKDLPISLEAAYKKLQDQVAEFKSLDAVIQLNKDISSFRKEVAGTKVKQVVNLIKGSDEEVLKKVIAALPANVFDAIQKALKDSLVVPKVNEQKASSSKNTDDDSFDTPTFHG